MLSLIVSAQSLGFVVTDELKSIFLKPTKGNGKAPDIPVSNQSVSLSEFQNIVFNLLPGDKGVQTNERSLNETTDLSVDSKQMMHPDVATASSPSKLLVRQTATSKARQEMNRTTATSPRPHSTTAPVSYKTLIQRQKKQHERNRKAEESAAQRAIAQHRMHQHFEAGVVHKPQRVAEEPNNVDWVRQILAPPVTAPSQQTPRWLEGESRSTSRPKTTFQWRNAYTKGPLYDNDDVLEIAHAFLNGPLAQAILTSKELPRPAAACDSSSTGTACPEMESAPEAQSTEDEEESVDISSLADTIRKVQGRPWEQEGFSTHNTARGSVVAEEDESAFAQTSKRVREQVATMSKPVHIDAFCHSLASAPSGLRTTAEREKQTRTEERDFVNTMKQRLVDREEETKESSEKLWRTTKGGWMADFGPLHTHAVPAHTH